VRQTVGVFAALLTLAIAPAASADSWSAGQPTVTPHAFAATATLQNGKVLAIGGFSDPTTPTGTVDSYDPATGVWSPAASLGTERPFPLAATLAGGQVLVIGPGDSAEVYNPTANAWTDVTNQMQEPHGGPPAIGIPETAAIAPLPDGRALIAGGTDASKHADIYDLPTNSFIPAADMPDARELPSVVALPNGKALVVGGVGTTGPLASAVVYDPSNNTWSGTSNDMAIPHVAPEVAPLPGGKVLIFGGANGDTTPALTTDAEIYDPATKSFTQTGSMVAPDLFGFSVALTSGRVLAGTGFPELPDSSGPPPTTPVAALTQVYSPAAGTWSISAPIPTPELGPGAAALPGDRAIVFGGTPSFISTTVETRTQIYAGIIPASAPQNAIATPGNGVASVSWTPPASAGNGTISHYVITDPGGLTITTPDARTSVMVGGLTNGVPASFTVVAVNEAGAGAPATTAPVTPNVAPVTPNVAPADTTAPTIKVSKLKTKLKLKSFLSGLTASITPSEDASLSITLLASVKKATIARAYNLTLGSKSYGRSGSTRKIKVKPSKKLVGKAKKFTVRVKIVATDASGNARTVNKTVHVSK
jgi:hypothetical protein